MLKAFVISVLAIVVCFGVMDALWLGFIADDIYQQEMQGMLRSQYPVWPWVTFYLVYATSIAILAVQPSFGELIAARVLQSNVIVTVALRGFVLGLAAYGAYNLTNYAILQDWSLKISLIDWTWGCFISASSATAAAVSVNLLVNTSSIKDQ